MCNLMHLEIGVKVDLIVRKPSEFRQVEFAGRQPGRDRRYPDLDRIFAWAPQLGVTALLDELIP
jgi:hypothetical protein